MSYQDAALNASAHGGELKLRGRNNLNGACRCEVCQDLVADEYAVEKQYGDR